MLRKKGKKAITEVPTGYAQNLQLKKNLQRKLLQLLVSFVVSKNQRKAHAEMLAEAQIRGKSWKRKIIVEFTEK